MRKNKNLLILLLVLISISVYYYLRNSNSSIRGELKDFAVKDTAAITKIFLADKKGNTITLDKISGKGWIVNGKYKASKDVLNNLMEVIYKVDVRTPVAKAAYNNVVKQLATTGIKCEIYGSEQNKPLKVYYVGHQTEDALGTFMMLENSASPFITQITGFDGYLTPRYTTDIYDWRDRLLFSSKPEDIKSLSVQYPSMPERSLRVDNVNRNFILKEYPGNDPVSNVDSIGLENYLALYSFIGIETFDKKSTQQKKDSILSGLPLAIISLDSKSTGYKEIKIYPMPISDQSLEKTDSEGHPLKYDADRMYGFLGKESEMVTIQHFVFDKLLRQKSDFIRTGQK